jgi:hypothetical protein
VPAVAEVRQTEPRHPDQAVDVRLEHDLLVLLSRGVDRFPAEGEARVVEEDVETAELADGPFDERLAARPVGDVQLVREVRVDLSGPPRAAGHCRARLAEGFHGGRADAARRARDDRGTSY